MLFVAPVPFNTDSGCTAIHSHPVPKLVGGAHEMSSISSSHTQREREVCLLRRPSRWEFEGYQHASWGGGLGDVLDKCTGRRGNFPEFSCFEIVEHYIHGMSLPEVEENSLSSACISTRELSQNEAAKLWIATQLVATRPRPRLLQLSSPGVSGKHVWREAAASEDMIRTDKPDA